MISNEVQKVRITFNIGQQDRILSNQDQIIRITSNGGNRSEYYRMKFKIHVATGGNH